MDVTVLNIFKLKLLDTNKGPYTGMVCFNGLGGNI